ncbi:MAG: Do family serine endopeptidase [Bacteroidia bacterium]
MKKLISTIFIAFVGGVAAIGLNALISKSIVNNETEPLIQAGRNSLIKNVNLPSEINSETGDFKKAAEESLNAVVHITTQSEHENLVYDPFARFFGMQPKSQTYVQQGSGSGVIVNNNGYIVTNNHVIAGADQIDVILNDKRSYKAEVIGADPSTDIALLKIKESDLPYLNYGNSDDVKVGEWVLAVGNPFNLYSTVTAGIISAKGRNNIISNKENPLESFLQTDAAVNPGNSGGALVNTKGELIGINTAIASNNGAYQGYSFAIPVNIVKKVIADLVEFGSVQRAYIGVSIRDIDARFAKENQLKTLSGVFVAGLTEGGSAKEAGIKTGDIITGVQDVPVKVVSELHEQIAKYRPGDKVIVNLIRDEKEMSLPVVLKSLENSTTLVKKSSIERVSLGKHGVALANVSKEQLSKLGVKNGVKVAKLSGKSKLALAGIKEGFIITSINKALVGEAGETGKMLDDLSGGVLIEGIYPNGMRAYYGFGL